MHVYAFGSIIRGQIDQGSDLDLLAIVGDFHPNLSPEKFSIYSYTRIRSLWDEGSPFAWHLSLESKLLFSNDGSDFLKGLGEPSPYRNFLNDCHKFHRAIEVAVAEIHNATFSATFELSNIFLGVRNLATCYSLGVLHKPIFERRSALHLSSDPLRIDAAAFMVLERARLISTRGYGDAISIDDQKLAFSSLTSIKSWADKIISIVESKVS